MAKAIILVLDSFGIGSAPDAENLVTPGLIPLPVLPGLLPMPRAGNWNYLI